MRPKRHEYLTIKEAAVEYEVSRAKLHRLIQGGRLQPAKDPRDERVTLLRTQDLNSLFRFPQEEAPFMGYETNSIDEIAATGRLTAELRERVDALRARIGKSGYDSTAIIREERDRRDRQIGRAVFGETESDEAGHPA